MAEQPREGSTGGSGTEQADSSAGPGAPGSSERPDTPAVPRSAADKERSKQQSRPVSGKEAARTAAQRKAPGKNGAKAAARKGAAGKDAAGKGTATSGTADGGRSGRGGSGQGQKGKPPRPAQAGRPSKGAPAGKTSGRPAGARPSAARPGRPAPSRRPPTAAPRRSPTTILTIGTVALVLVIVVVLVVVKVVGGGSSSAKGDSPLPAEIAHDIQNVPASVYDTVGINSSAEKVTPPSVLHGQPPLQFTANGKTLPGIFYYGAEYCPYCAAERWALAATLARFGKFQNLQATESSTSDVFAGTQTISFHSATFTSPYVAFRAVEAYTNQPAPNGQGYTKLETPTRAEIQLVEKYDTSQYVSGLQSNQNGAIPFINFANKAVVAGASFSPALLDGLSRGQIAANLNDPSNPVTQAIIATSNYLSAATCAGTGQQPANVCKSKGVTEAAKAMKLTG